MKTKYKVLWAWTPLMIIFDQVTKYAVHFKFTLGESIPIVPGYFNLTYVRNTGAAFGFMAQADPAFRVPFFLAVPIVALGVIWMLFKRLPDKDLRMSSALALVFSGAIGNLIDRAYLGFVIDFLDFHWRHQAHFPAFNIADSAICVGVGIMILDMFSKQPALDRPVPEKA